MGLKSLAKRAEECQAQRRVEIGDRLSSFRPKPGGQTEFYDLVMESLQSGKFPRAVNLIGGIGCISGDTLINGVPAKELQNSPITVETLIGESSSSPVYLKGQANLYRVTTQHGHCIEVTEFHNFLSPKGWRPLRSLRVGDFVAVRDNEGDLPVRGKSIGSQGSCFSDFHHGGEQSHPSLVFAQEKIRQSYGQDRYFSSSSNQRYALHPIADYSLQNPDALFSFQSPYALDGSELPLDEHQSYQQASGKSLHSDIAQLSHPLEDRTVWSVLSQASQQAFHVCELHSRLDSEKRQDIWLSHNNCTMIRNAKESLQYLRQIFFVTTYFKFNGGNYLNCNDKWDKIEAIEYVKYDNFYDLHVPVTNHYLANNFWNHNSGKSYAGAWYACIRAKQDPQSRGLISANEFNQLRTSTIVALAEFCDRFGVPLSPVGETPDETARMITARQFCTIYDAPVLVLSANKFGGSTTKAKQGARGTQLRYAWLDEWAYADRSAWETLNGRLGRGEGSIPGQAVITSSINRNYPFNWVYDTFSDPDRSPEIQQLYKAIRCLTADNDSLDPEYLRSLEASYTPELAALELRGEYMITTEGLLFNYFNRNKHVDGGLGYNPRYPLRLSFDFNRSPACAIAGQSDGNNLFIFKEWYLLNSDTFELAKAVANWAKSLEGTITPYGVPANPVFVYGDASGNAKTANSKTTNWAIVTTELKGLRWTQQWGSSNPSIVDSVNSCNSMLWQNRVYIHPECKQFIKDLESMKDDGKGGIDKKDPLRTHLGDGFRYLCHTMFPLPDGRRQWRTDAIASWS